jgi:outer membrane receptor protein involved in Fe transport
MMFSFMKYSLAQRRWTILAFVAFMTSPSWSQGVIDGRLNEVQVINTSPLPGIGIEKNKLPFEVQFIDSKALKNSDSLNITEYMNENLNGVNINDIQGSPYQADVTYRGSRASATLGAAQGLSVYLDGVRVNEPFGDVVNWDMLPEAAFENVTLVPGSNPVYGLNTLGGALAFTTKSGLTTQGNELGLTFGNHGRAKVDLTHGSKSPDGWHRFIAVSAFNEKGWRDYSDGHLQNLFVKVGRTQEDSNWDISFLSGTSKLKGNGLLPSTNYGDIAGPFNTTSNGLYELQRSAIYSHVDITENNTNLLTFNLQRLLDQDTELASTAYLRSGMQKRLSGEVVWCATDSREDSCVQKYGGVKGALAAQGILGVLNGANTNQTSSGLSLNLTKVLDSHQLTLGSSLDVNISSYAATVDSDCLVDSSRGVNTPCNIDTAPASGVRGQSAFVGMYGADNIKLGPSTQLNIAARFNHASVHSTITDQNQERIYFNSLNPSIGMVHQLDNSINVFGNWGQSNRVPTVIEMGCADSANPCNLPTGLQADPPLKQVVSQTFEGGVRWRRNSNDSISMSWYRTTNKDDILFYSTTPGLGFFKNFDKTRYQGVDLSTSHSWGPWQLNTTYSYLHATYEASAQLAAAGRVMSITPGMRLPGLPEHHLKVHLNWQANDQWNLGATVDHTTSIVSQGNEDGLIGIQNSTIIGNADVKGYNLLHFKANYQVDKGLSFFGKINNVLNTRYETYGLLHQNNFNPDGTLLNSANPTLANFIAPGAPRTFLMGMRYQF